jgi:hypothetical protein
MSSRRVGPSPSASMEYAALCLDYHGDCFDETVTMGLARSGVDLKAVYGGVQHSLTNPSAGSLA